MIDPFHARFLDAELRAAGVRVVGCSSKGRIDYRPDADDTDRQKAAAVLAAHNRQACDEAEKREREERVAVNAELRVMALERLKARGWPPKH